MQARPALQAALDELHMRRDVLRALLLVGLFAALIYLGLGSAGGLRSIFFPWDGVGLILVTVIIGAAVWRGNPSARAVSVGAAWFLALGTQPFFYFSQTYGLQSPVNALFVFSIIAAALLIGLWFIPWWTFGMCGWMIMIGFGQLRGAWATPLTASELLGYSLLWSFVFGGTGGLAWFFARYLDSALQASRRQTETLAQLSSLLTHEPELGKFLDQALALIAAQFKAGQAAVFLREGDSLQLRHSHGPSQPTPPPMWPALLRDPQPTVHQSQLIVPLIQGDSAIGCLVISNSTPHHYRAEELSLARALAAQVTLALQLTQLADQNRRAAVLEERTRLARDIHDTLAQGFTGIVIQLEAAEDALAGSRGAAAPGNVGHHLARARELARTSLAEARRSVRALRPAALEHNRFLPALRDSVEALTADSGMSLHLTLPGSLPALAPEAETELLRLAQEAVTNALKHAQASTLSIAFAHDHGILTLTVSDNGLGFEPGAAHSGFGLIGLRERAERIGARFSIESKPNAGTTITVTIPVSDNQ